ncbi:MAG: hypothetical protein CL878_13585 [Dehalococcoidia bacterium]|nr:hypothetical protein [Dehalococcoidia bacterium]
MTVEALVEAARAEGYAVTARQVERWHKAHLLPRRHQRHVRGLRGSVGVYPAGTEVQFLALCRLRQQRRKLSELRFWLWWEGYAIELDPLRASLRSLLPAPDTLGTIRADADERFEAGERMTNQLIAATPNRSAVLARFRRRLRTREDVYSAAFALLRVLQGERPPWRTGAEVEGEEQPLQDSVWRGLGLDRVPWLVGATSDAVPAVVADLESGGFSDLGSLHDLVAAASAETLTQARDNARLVLGMAEALNHLTRRPDRLPPVVAKLGHVAWGLTFIVVVCLVLQRAWGDGPFESFRLALGMAGLDNAQVAAM